MRNILLSLLGILTAISLLLVAKEQIPGPSWGGATPGSWSSVGSSSQTSVGSSTANTIFSATNGCTSRVISTGPRAIMLSFGSTTPTGSDGHWQGASTTVAYDSEIFGFVRVRA